jgi:hypothetical protein
MSEKFHVNGIPQQRRLPLILVDHAGQHTINGSTDLNLEARNRTHLAPEPIVFGKTLARALDSITTRPAECALRQ